MRYFARKVLYLVITFWAAVTINFLLPRMMPGNPATVLKAKFQGRLTEENIQALSVMFGVDNEKPMIMQYADYIGNLLRGDLGVSIGFFPEDVSTIIARSAPWTIGLIGVTTVVAFVLGTLLGIVTAWRKKALSNLTVVMSFFMNTLPYFWFAMLMSYIFAFRLEWFDLGGPYSDGTEGFWGMAGSIIWHAVLPALTIVLTAAGGWVLTMRNNMINVIQQDFISFARARGLPDRQIKMKYAARNAILPNFTGFAMAIGFIMSGSLLTEVVFSYPGLGYMLYQAVVSLDYPLMQGVFLFVTIVMLLANFIADICYMFIDPRVR